MSKFKDMVKRDIHKVFLNTDEFAEKLTVRYDGIEYPNIAIVMEGPIKEHRDRLTDDHVRGLHMVTGTIYCAQSDLGGKIPKPGTGLEINTREGGKFFHKYYVTASTSNMGMLHVELEEMAQ